MQRWADRIRTSEEERDLVDAGRSEQDIRDNDNVVHKSELRGRQRELRGDHQEPHQDLQQQEVHRRQPDGGRSQDLQGGPDEPERDQAERGGAIHVDFCRERTHILDN